MTDPTSKRLPHANANRPSTGIGPVWKSGILAGGMGAVILGWALLIKVNGPVTVAPEPAQVSMASTTLNTLSTPAAVTGATPRTTLRALPAMPTMPEKPVFQGPVTRTRRS